MRLWVKEPLVLAGDLVKSVDITATVKGGGLAGQAEALRVAISRALVSFSKDKKLKERFLEQAKKKQAGVEETHPIDEDFIEALEYGMPPAGGIGIGIDRIVLLLANLPNLRETILFPTLKPENVKKKRKKKSKK